MVLAISEEFITLLLVTDENNNPATGKTISYRIFDEAKALVDSGSMTELGSYGIYYKAWTPDAAGYWIFEAYYSGSDFHFYDIKMYQVGQGVEDDVEDRIKASPDVSSIFWKSGGATCPTGKSIWDALGDGTVSLNTLNDLLTDGTYGLAALETLVDEVETLLKDSTYGLSALNADLDNIISELGNVTYGLSALNDDLDSIIGELGDVTYGLSALNDDLDSIISELGNVTYGLSALNVDLDAIISSLANGTYGLNALKTAITAVNTDLGDFSAQTNLKSLLQVLGVPDVAGKNLYTLLVTDRLDNATYGLNALDTDLGTLITRLGNPDGHTLTSITTKMGDLSESLATILETFSAAEAGGLGDRIAFIQQFIGKGSGTVLPSNKSLYDVIALDRLDHVTYGLSALNTDLDSIIANIGNFQGRTYQKTILAALGLPDVSGKDLYTLLVTDRLDNATYGLSALNTDLDSIISSLANGTYGLSQLDTEIDALENKLKASPSVDSILFKSGGSVCPSGKSIWDALGDGTITLNTLNTLLTSGTYGLNALYTILTNVTYGLSALNTDLDAIIAYVDSLETWLGNPSAHTLTTITAKLGDNATAIGTVTDRLYALVQATSTLTGTPTTNFFDTNLAEATDDHYNGSIIIFTSGNLAGQASVIVDYDGSSKELVVDPAFIEAPSSGNAFVIVSNPLGALKIGSKGLNQIYDLIDSLPVKLSRIGDTVTSTGSEVTIFISDSPSNKFELTKFIVDLTAMQAGDTLVFKEYYRIKSGGNYILKSTNTYSDDVDPDLNTISLEPNLYGVKITLQRTAGSDRSIDFEVWSKER